MIKFNEYRQHTKYWDTLFLDESDVYIPTMKTINPRVKISSSRFGTEVVSYYSDERIPWTVEMSLTDLGSSISYTGLE